MKRLVPVAAACAAVLVLSLSCGQRRSERHSGLAARDTDASRAAVIDSLQAEGGQFVLCTQLLTSPEALDNLDVPADSSYDSESTPDRYSYFFPEDDIELTPEVERYALLYNLSAVYNHLIHSYELHCRKLSAHEDTLLTRSDTLETIAHDVYAPSGQLLTDVVRDREALDEVYRVVDAASRYDGDDSEGAAYTRAMERFRTSIHGLGMPVDYATLDEFTEEFWTWYDKKPYVPQIDRIVRLRLKDSGVEITQDQLVHLRDVVWAERDIDRRTVLALAYAKWDRYGGAILLGEILESGIYTRYILEAWITWRACVQMSVLGPSSFTTIPDNYYDRIRVKCMNTIIRHMQSPDADKYDICLLANLMYCQVVHRQGSLVGNGSFATLADLQYGMFVHPDALGHDYLKEQE